MSQESTEFQYLLEQFSDYKVMRYTVPGFDALSLKQKELLYYLSQAALSGRDITFDQHYKYNLLIRCILENIYRHLQSDDKAEIEPRERLNFEHYIKAIWFSNGIHHHNSTEKILPQFSQSTWRILFKYYDGEIFNYPDSYPDIVTFLEDVMFNPKVASKRVSLESDKDMVKNSAVNFYENLNQQEVEDYYEQQKQQAPNQKWSFGVNSFLKKENDQMVEEVYKIGGKYSSAIEQIVFWLQKALEVCETTEQKQATELLIRFYQTGDLQIWDDYNIAWVKDLHSHTDFVNGFIEVYGDPMGMKATWESVVNFKDLEATKRTNIISQNAQWFEDHSPIDEAYKKPKVKGVTAKAINMVQLGGDCYPTTPIGINLPNADWIRAEYGSKSVTIENIVYAYDQASKASGFLEEFVLDAKEIEMAKQYGSLASNLHTDLHECLGHGSGRLAPGISAEALKNHASTLEEARADLFALYYLMDDQMQKLGLFDTKEVAKAEYNAYIRNGLMSQLVRVKPGENLEEAHMRNRQLVAAWCYEKGKADKTIEMFKQADKTYIKINDYQKLRELFGALLKEVQRIKSEGDYEAGKALIESYAVKVNPELHQEVLERFKKLNIAPYGGFVNPVLKPVYQDDKIIDVRVEYAEDYAEQMLYYSKKYSFLKPE